MLFLCNTQWEKKRLECRKKQCVLRKIVFQITRPQSCGTSVYSVEWRLLNLTIKSGYLSELLSETNVEATCIKCTDYICPSL